MSPLRFVLILFLTVALDLSSPLPSPSAEAIEEMEEALHARQERRSFRLLRDVVAPSIAHEIRRLELCRPQPLPRTSLRPVATVTLVRKLPAPLAEPSTAPEDH